MLAAQDLALDYRTGESVAHADLAEQRLRVGGRLMVAADGPNHDVLERAQVVDQEVLLKDEAEALPAQPHQARSGQAGKVVILEPDRPPAGPFQPGEEVHQRALS